MALAMIEGAERDGLLAPGDTAVEYTGGSTGPSLALVLGCPQAPRRRRGSFHHPGLTDHSASPVAERRLEPPGHVPERELEAAADEERLAQSVRIGGIGDCVQRLAAPTG
jgi:hypothetical protein